jgi:hypothetical protein
MRLRLALALSLLSVRPESDVEVSLKDSRVVVRTAGAPLVDVLTRFAQATGAEVVYEAARPRQLVSAVIDASSASEAIGRLLEGQGINYVLRLDPTGRNVEMLVITGSAGSTTPVAGATRTPRPGPPAFRVPEEVEEPEPGGVDQPYVPDAAEGLEPSVPSGTTPADAASPAFGAPSAGGAPGVQPGEGPPEGSAGSPAPASGPPQFPAPASYPGGVPFPPQPVFPGPASYPGGG